MLRIVALTPLLLLASGCASIGVPTPTPAPQLMFTRPGQAVVKVVAATGPPPAPLRPTVAAATAQPLPTRLAPTPAFVAPSTPTAVVLAPSQPPVQSATPTVGPPAFAAPVGQPTGPPPFAPAATKPADPAPEAPVIPTPTIAPPSTTPSPTALAATATPSITPTATLTPTVTVTVVPNQVGQRFISGPVGLTVHNAAKAVGSTGNVRVIAEVTLENLGSGSMAISPTYFKLTVGSGGPNSPYTAGANGTTMPAASRPVGWQERAYVAFEIPIEARGLILSYEPTPPPPGYTSPIRIGLGE
jgi:hypothetical protein